MRVSIRQFGLVLMFCGATSVSHAGDFTNFLGIRLVDIPAGSFEMGACKLTEGMRKENRKRIFLGLPAVTGDCASDGNAVNDNETPRHKVRVRAFRLGATPVTLGQYKKYLQAIGAGDGTSGWNLYNDEFRNLNAFGDNAPVVQVSWHEAKEFIKWLNKSKPADDHNTYRLASEAEWEYACRAGRTQRYCGSDNVDDVGWVDREKNTHQHDVATKAPNAWGVYDMTGNVWEWVEDVYHDNYVGAPADGSAWLTSPTEEVPGASPGSMLASADEHGFQIEASFAAEREAFDAAAKTRRGVPIKSEAVASRVLRGGSWRFGVEFARATYRLAGEPGNWYYGNGFRIAATPP